ncbi:hypothetical protein HPB47_016545 [Ixodes persulcatus]|uniref:Uncharacterized protein n=1 Tax=Ixodes persulcatus TaxID=34615 RepID=A0AC60QQN6_IXOPE|nr:hypothetical protein HPB47_016545 [Ixodes persulcatus]
MRVQAVDAPRSCTLLCESQGDAFTAGNDCTSRRLVRAAHCKRKAGYDLFSLNRMPLRCATRAKKLFHCTTAQIVPPSAATCLSRPRCKEPDHVDTSYVPGDEALFRRLQEINPQAAVLRSIPKFNAEDTKSASKDEETGGLAVVAVAGDESTAGDFPMDAAAPGARACTVVLNMSVNTPPSTDWYCQLQLAALPRRRRIIDLCLKEYSQRAIADLVQRPLKTVNRIIQAYKNEGRIADAPHNRRPRVTTADQDQTIVAAVAVDPFLSARDVNTPTIYRRFSEAGLESRIAAQKHRLSEDNKRQRYDPEFLQEVVASGRSVVNVWGAVSYQGLGPLHRIEGRLTSENYCNILDDVMLPYPEEKQAIGGYMVRKVLLKMVELGPTKTAALYVRELLPQIFREDKLTGKSISGKKSSAHKDKDAKPQLDPIRTML